MSVGGKVVAIDDVAHDTILLVLEVDHTPGFRGGAREGKDCLTWGGGGGGGEGGGEGREERGRRGRERGREGGRGCVHVQIMSTEIIICMVHQTLDFMAYKYHAYACM